MPSVGEAQQNMQPSKNKNPLHREGLLVALLAVDRNYATRQKL
jgi:hypothetical protein